MAQDQEATQERLYKELLLRQEKIEKIRTIAFLQSYIETFKRPDWYSWFGLYEQKERVKRAEARLKDLLLK